MFICETCYEENYGPSFKTFRSYGPCEICGKTKPCLEKSHDREMGESKESPQ